ncbi:DSBA-like thioredoxin domain protein [Thalassovita gelatinovora]|uniref:DSBA-like thioredoxin domain protein n=1 Tax=Thalassovita gelatinovora TaxID=53501 RepID=A0A0P1FK56_THAGE|nr:DsbA family oxidoreductase [Thalassovita gelatinovora]QIZ81716.1 DsbA family oxidoreductase [Thalassovita gelatinovora]CUH68283.1 DSBA-like thioredoxin domain protein [Thalassovita gelatinovora]SEQ32642.1 Predicted dithiol-disulfide isomerase, DsbA family [Thalassovita gelatinovora]
MANPIRVDIVSDVMCPWCFVGYHQLRLAQQQTGIGADIHWHPFELNPDMVPDGENIRDHMKRKYGATQQQSADARDRLTALGVELGAPITFSDDKRIYNTFPLHRMIHWAEQAQLGSALKLALLEAYFSDNKTMNDADAMADVAAGVGLDRDRALEILQGDDYTAEVRAKQQFWTTRGITGVPAMVFDKKHLVVGAQGVANYANILRQLSGADTEQV